MRILHILNHVQEIGNGIVNVAIDLACLQAKAGHPVRVVSAGGEYKKLLAQYGVKHLELNQQRTPRNLLQAIRRYQRIIQDFQPDIVHVHMMTGVVLAWLCKFQFSYALVATVHNEFQRSAVLMGLADRVICVSQAVADSMARRGISRSQLRVVANGTLGSPRCNRLDTYSARPLQRPAIATLAGMNYRKGIAELIQAFEQIAPSFPTAHLYLIGDGPNRDAFEAQAQATAVSDRIHFEGFQPEPQSYLLATDIFVLASHRDPFPLVISEAREAGCAIMASQVDGIPEALEQGEAGLLVPPRNSRVLAANLTQLLENPNLLAQWQGRSRQNLEWLSVTRVVEEVNAVYEELLGISTNAQNLSSGLKAEVHSSGLKP
ncbi:MAG: glycosyltransferase family 4 protein [Leptolyngbyaceae bacterium]|nr:glycosyltransferase family 4 protein [Leptolyngbyaceae bacterium]